MVLLPWYIHHTTTHQLTDLACLDNKYHQAPVSNHRLKCRPHQHRMCYIKAQACRPVTYSSTHQVPVTFQTILTRSPNLQNFTQASRTLPFMMTRQEGKIAAEANQVPVTFQNIHIENLNLQNFTPASQMWLFMMRRQKGDIAVKANQGRGQRVDPGIHRRGSLSIWIQTMKIQVSLPIVQTVGMCANIATTRCRGLQPVQGNPPPMTGIMCLHVKNVPGPIQVILVSQPIMLTIIAERAQAGVGSEPFQTETNMEIPEEVAEG